MAYEQRLWIFALTEIRIILTASLFHIVLISKADNLNDLLFCAPLLTVPFRYFSDLFFLNKQETYNLRVFMERAWFRRINQGGMWG